MKKVMNAADQTHTALSSRFLSLKKESESFEIRILQIKTS